MDTITREWYKALDERDENRELLRKYKAIYIYFTTTLKNIQRVLQLGIADEETQKTVADIIQQTLEAAAKFHQASIST